MSEVNPLDYEARTFRIERNNEAEFNKRVAKAGSIEALIASMAADEGGFGADELLHNCAGIWEAFPAHHAQIAAIALRALAKATDDDVLTAERLVAHIPDFGERDDLKAALQKIKAAKRARHRYYFKTRYQARNIDRLKAQLFPTPTQTISESARFVCIGSCFASNLGSALFRRGIKNIVAFRYQDDSDPLSVLDGVVRNDKFKHEISQGGEHVVILTAGFAESAGGFLSPADVAKAIVDIDRSLKSWNPQVRLIATVSPVPLAATSTGLSPYEANSISKAVMRLGVAEAQKQGVEYFPSYELVTQHFPAMGINPTGVDSGSPIYINADVILFITDLFISQYVPWVDLSLKELPPGEITVRRIGP